MSLNFDLSKIANCGTTCYETIEDTPERLETLVRSISFFGPSWGYDGDDRTRCIRMRAVTHVLVWGTMSVMMGSITEKNWRVFYTRFAMKEAALGASLINGDGSPAYITPEQVRAHIGLTTNVRTESAGKFNGRLVRNLARNAGDSLRNEVTSLAESRVSE
jgi:hypothetical protein